MFLNPAEPVWPGLLKAALVLTLFVVSGAPLAWAVFGGRGRGIWVGYMPVMGIGLNLLAANLFAWVAPGPPGSWLAVAAAVLAASVTVLRIGRSPGFPDWPRATWARLTIGVLLTVGLLYVALANRTHVLFTDEEWHLPLSATMANGAFPPVSPFSPAFGAAYHYGVDLLAASLINLAGIAPWTAFFLLAPMLTVVFALTAATVALDLGASRPVALGVGMVAAFANPSLIVGLPTVQGNLMDSDGAGDALRQFGVAGDAAPFRRMGPALLNHLHYALGLTLLLVMAASLQAGRGRWALATFGFALALLPLAETSTFVVGALATALYFAAGAWRWSWRDRGTFLTVAAAGIFLAVVGGGAVTDSLFRSTGGAGTQTGLSLDASVLTPGDIAPDGGLNLQVSLVVLAAGLLGVAVVQRSRSFGFLAAAAVAGLAAHQMLRFEVTGPESRLIAIPYQLAMLGVLAWLGMLIHRIRSAPARQVGSAALIALVIVPTAAPRTVSAVELSAQGIHLGYPIVQDELVRYANQTRFAASLRDEWRALDWIRRELPIDSRILTANAPLMALATGRSAPQAGRHLAVFNPVLPPVYLDALTHLARVDLEELDTTHLYVTAEQFEAMDADARESLDDPSQFVLLTSQLSASGAPLRVYEIQPGAGRLAPSASGYRNLALLGREASSIAVGGFLSVPERQTLRLTFPPEQIVIGAETFIPRSSSHAEYQTPDPNSRPDLLIMHRTQEPLEVGSRFEEAVWHGHGLRAYSTVDGAWSPTWRPQREPNPPPSDITAGLSRPGDSCQLLLLGEPGDLVTAGDAEVRLSGTPQLVRTDGTSCQDVQVAWRGGDVPPFIQTRWSPSGSPSIGTWSAGLAFDGGVSEGIGVFHLWYRNPREAPVPGGTEFRLYRAGPDGLIAATTPAESIAWWLGPIELPKPRLTKRFEFDAARLTLNGLPPLEQSRPMVDGSYVLTLHISERADETAQPRVRRVIPLVQVAVRNGQATYRPLSGIVGVD